MDEDEVRQQMEATKYYSFLREKRRQEQLAKMEEKEKEIEEEFQGQLIDLNTKLVRQNTDKSTSETDSKKLSNSSKTRPAGIVKHGTSIGSLLAKKTMPNEPKKSYLGGASMNRFMRKGE